jgi:hypothetical protein
MAKGAARSKAIANMTDNQIGMVDPYVRKLLNERATLEEQAKELAKQGYGAQHPEMVRIAAQLADTKAKIQKYTQEWRDQELKRAPARESAASAGREALTPAAGGHGIVGGVQLDLVSLANSTVEAAGAVRVAKAEVALKRKLKESGAANDLERDQANLETAVKRLELLKGIAAIALEGATQELARPKQLYQQGVQSEREVSDAQSRVKMLQLIVNSAG